MSKGFDPADDLAAFGSVQNNMDLFQRLNAMLENNIDLSSLAQAESTRRNMTVSDLLNNPQQEDVMALLQQHQLNQALQQQLEQHRQQLRLNSAAIAQAKPDALAKLLPATSSQRGLGESPVSTGSSGASGLRLSGSNGNVFSGGIQAATHSTPTSAGRAIRGTPIRRDTGSPTLEQMLLMSCNQRSGGEPQGASATVDSEFSMLSTPGVTSSMETSLSELMQSLSLRGTGSTSASPTARWLSLQQQQQQQQQQQALQAAKLQASLQAAFQQSNLLGSLGCLESSGQTSSLQNLQTSLQNIQDLASLQNLQVWQNLRNLQTLQNLAGNGALNTAALSALLQGCSSPTTTAFNDRPETWNTQLPPTPESSSLERAARLYRSAAALSEATYTWSGILPPRPYNKNPTYSCKVFLGGVPWDITEAVLLNAFKQYGNIKVEWPGKDSVANPPKGYVYIIFEHEKQVKNLLQACTQDYSNGGWYYKISSRRMRSKEVQVIPWALSDSNFVRTPSNRLDPQKTVFVGALHGMLNAEGLAHIMNDLFGGVLYAGIDTDKHKYPIGSGRVTFSNNRSYMKAVAAAFIEIKTPKFSKKVQVDPYLEDSLCAVCGVHQGPYFCRDLTCFKYFCRSCWQWQHNNDLLKHHRPLMRHYKGSYLSNSGASAGSNGTSGTNNNEGSPVQSQSRNEEQLTEST